MINLMRVGAYTSAIVLTDRLFGYSRTNCDDLKSACPSAISVKMVVERAFLSPEQAKPVVILTGHTGRLGAPLANQLAKAGYSVVGVSRGCQDIVSHTISLKSADLTDKKEVAKLLDFIEEAYGTRDVACIIHSAGLYGFDKSPDPDKYYKINVLTTKNLLRQADKKGFKVGQFILFSSQAVYKSAPKGGFLTEESPVRDDYPYPASKLRAEKLLLTAPCPTVTIRVPSVYDDECNNEGVGKIISWVAQKSLLCRFYPGDQHENGWSYMHMDDFTRAIQCVVDAREWLAKENPHALFHIGEYGCTSQIDLQSAIALALERGGFTSFEIPGIMGVMGAELMDIMLETPFTKKFAELFTKGEDSVHPWMVKALGRVFIDTSAFRRAFPEYKMEHRILDTVPKMIAAAKKDPEHFAKRNGIKNVEGFKRGLE